MLLEPSSRTSFNLFLRLSVTSFVERGVGASELAGEGDEARAKLVVITRKKMDRKLKIRFLCIIEGLLYHKSAVVYTRLSDVSTLSPSGV